MDYEIRYVRSADGTIIAVMSRGSGPYLVSVAGIANIQSMLADLATPDRKVLLDGLAQHHTLITYDPRGVGLSQREVDDVSLDAHVADLAAVVDSLADGDIVFRARGNSCPVAVRYVSTHSARASALILAGPTVRGVDRTRGEGRRAIASLMEYDFDLWVQVLLLMDLGWKDGAQVYEAIGSNNISREMLQRQFMEMRRWDMTDDLSRITCPTLVLYIPTPDVAAVGPGPAQQVAAAIPNARFQPIVWDLVTGDSEQLNVMLAFLGVDHERDAHLVRRAKRDETGFAATAIILFADIADSTALTERHGDAAFRAKARALDDALRAAVRDNGGAVIDAKTLGDGILATFPAASQAIAAALACGVAGDAAGLPLHVGLHAGDVIRESDNVYGGAVNIAARISALASPGEVLVSRTIADLARTSAGVTFEDRGEHPLKGITEPQRVFAVRAS
jgi:class 3 adenylate cyclase/pimeloyl-ACP methyl ester carboxylesterase